MKAQIFEQDGKKLWTKEATNGTTVVSGCVEIVEESLDLNTLFVREEKSMVWIKGNSEELVTKQLNTVIANVKNGTLRPYRQFSETPFYEGQAQDINPTTQAELGRYSQVRLCPSAQHATLHRQYVTVPTMVASEQPSIATTTEATTTETA